MTPTARFLTVLVAASLTACGAPPSEREVDTGDALPGQFSGPLAWAELEALAAAPRPLGSEGAEAARSHITTRLASSGISAETVTTTAQSQGFGPVALTHLVATLP